MLFSELVGISLTQEDDWFDPILHQDTKLFIDPFLVFKSQHPLFKDSYSVMMEFFNKIFQLIAESGGNQESASYKKAVGLLVFHEVNEISLGYSPSRDGAGPGIGMARTMAANIWSCIAHKIDKVKHFEEIGLLHTGIGADHISDITANLLKEKLVFYTQEICRENNVEMAKVRLQNSKLDKTFWRWEHLEVELPVNPNKGKGILLVPKSFLRDLPEINKDDFIKSVRENEVLRADLNYEIDKNIKKDQIAQIAIENYAIVEKYIEQVEDRAPTPYDVNRDPELKYSWYNKACQISEKYPLKLVQPTNSKDFIERVSEIIENFVTFVELNAGYKLLWSDGFARGKSEEAVQLLFHGIVEQHCKANNIDLSREVNQGRGPVDFKFSNGYREKALLEIKLIRNTKFWNGLRAQLPHYLAADHAKQGFFLAVAYTEEDLKKVQGIKDVVAEVNAKNGLEIGVIVVDAQKEKVSASNLKDSVG